MGLNDLHSTNPLAGDDDLPRDGGDVRGVQKRSRAHDWEAGAYTKGVVITQFDSDIGNWSMRQ